MLKKANAIVKYTHKSNMGTEVLDDNNEKKLRTAVPTRWNSQLTSVQSVLACKKDSLDQLDTKHKLTSRDRDMLTEFVVIMQPFAEATDARQRQ